MTKDEMVDLLRSAGVEPRIFEAMVQSYEMGFEEGGRACANLRDAIEYGISMCEHLDFDELLSAKQMAENFRRAIAGSL